MGQTMGRMPDTWQELMEERDRVIHWSSEVLARVQDNVTNEDTFLMDYDDNKIDAKVDSWIKTNQTRVNDTFGKYPNAPDRLKSVVQTGIAKVIDSLLNLNFYKRWRLFIKSKIIYNILNALQLFVV